VRFGVAERLARETAVRLGAVGWRTVLCFDREPTGEVLERLGVPRTSLDTFPDAARQGWRGVRNMIRLLRRYRPRVLHLQFTPFLSAYPWLARLYGVKTVLFTDHGSRPEGHVTHRAGFWKRVAGKFLAAPYSGVVEVSDYNRRTLIAAGYVDAERVKRIYHGADPDRCADPSQGIQFRRRHGIPLERTLVLQVSWIIPEKGIADLLGAARLVLDRDPNVHFAFVGEGAGRDRYTREAESLGIAGNVTWTGLSKDPFGEGVFAAADISCQMSRWEEAFGCVIAEAMFHSKPVVATRVGGIPEVVRDGETGFLVARGDQSAMADKILLLAGDAGLRQRMGQAGRRLAEVEFDARKNLGPVLEMYGAAEGWEHVPFS
jgi:glycosyltransferase involved in cell wall biosynthesis